MRGTFEDQGRLFSYISPEQQVAARHPLRTIRERLQHGDIFNRFMEKLLHHKEITPLLSGEHFSVDGTLIETRAGHKSFKPKDDKDGDGEHFHGTTRKNATHASTTDPDSRLYRKSAVTGLVTQASGTAERAASEKMLAKKASPHARITRITVGADKAYDVEARVKGLRAKNITPHIAVKTYVTKTGKARKTAIDGQTTRQRATPSRKTSAT